jgi:hypothetical protein
MAQFRAPLTLATPIYDDNMFRIQATGVVFIFQHFGTRAEFVKFGINICQINYSGMYYKHITIVNDDSSFSNK